MDKNKTLELRILKTILWIYIILCIAIAGLNYGYASHASPSVVAFINWLWHFYENWIKTLFIIICSILTIRIIGSYKRTVMIKRNLTGFVIAALVVHIILPLVIGKKNYIFLQCHCHGQLHLCSYYLQNLLFI